MARVGGLFKVLDASATQGDPHDPDTRRFYDAYVWGVVYSTPREYIYEGQAKSHIRFGMRFRRHKLVQCRVYADNPFAYSIARKLRIGDPVFMLGKLQEFFNIGKRGKYKGKRMEHKEMEIHILFPVRHFVAWMTSDTADDDRPDLIEGLEDYLSEQERKEEEEYDG